jgi:hypothetical protein
MAWDRIHPRLTTGRRGQDALGLGPGRQFGPRHAEVAEELLVAVVEPGRRLAATIPGAGLLVLEGYGHLAPSEEVWAQVSDAIAELTGKA